MKTLPCGVMIVNRPDPFNVLRLDMAALPMITSMEQNGMLIDSTVIDKLHKRITDEMEQLQAEVTQLTGYSINLGSGDQLSDLIYGQLGLRQSGKEKWTKSKARLSADGDVLQAMVSKHPAIKKILDWKQREKLRSTYCHSLVAQADEGGRIHPSLNHTIAETGRLSCVHGSTILHTNRGDFTFDEYELRPGDMAFTHRLRWRKILRKIYQGVDRVLS